jgi:translation initiation factor IF-3
MAHPTSSRQKREFKIYTNDQIRAHSITVIDSDGENLGTFQRDKALVMASDQ